MVVKDARVNSERKQSEPNYQSYEPRQVKLGSFQTSSACQLVLPAPPGVPWPANCATSIMTPYTRE
jgi:hypothetical protein